MADPNARLYLRSFLIDVENALAWSEDRFGEAAANRYAALIQQALSDLLEDPVRPGTRRRLDLAPGAYVYHLMFSRERVSGERVRSPRHFVLYRYTVHRTEFARLLHDSHDLQRHLPGDYRR